MRDNIYSTDRPIWMRATKKTNGTPVEGSPIWINQIVQYTYNPMFGTIGLDRENALYTLTGMYLSGADDTVELEIAYGLKNGETYYTESGSELITVPEMGMPAIDPAVDYYEKYFTYETADIQEFAAGTTYYTYDEANDVYNEVDTATETFDPEKTYYTKETGYRKVDTFRFTYTLTAEMNDDNELTGKWTGGMNGGNGYTKDKISYLNLINRLVTEGRTLNLVEEDGVEGTYEFTLKNGEEIKLSYIPEGYKYEVWELSQYGWRLVSKTHDKGEFQNDEEEITSVFHNTPLFDIWIKKSNEQRNKFLDGAKFKLYYLTTKPDGTYEQGNLVQVKIGETMADEFEITSADDGVKLSELSAGKYRLVETKAPDGYIILSKSIDFEVGKTDSIISLLESGDYWLSTTGTNPADIPEAEDRITNNTLNIVNTSGASLPSTGSDRTFIYTVIGACMLVCAGAAVMIRRRRAE